MKPLILLSMLALSLSAHALDLNQYMDQVVKTHRGLEALRASRDAAEDNRVAGDISLVPVFSLTGTSISDKKQPNQLGATEARVTDYSARLAKKFSSGTSVSLNAHSAGYENVGLSSPLFSSFEKYGQGSLGISIEQSLWKDAFGHGTRLRQARESTAAQAEKGGYDLQSRQILASAESAYWDYIYSQEELKLRRASLERAQKLEAWFRRRAADGISDRADVLTAQALVASRKLQLTNVEDGLVTIRQNIQNQLELQPGQNLPELTGDIAKARDPKALVTDDGGKIVRLDAWIASLNAKASQYGAEEAKDATSADLKLSGNYNTNSYAAGGSASDTTKEWTKTDTPTSSIALTWVYMFDTDVKAAASGAANKRALASKLQSERAMLESETGWSEVLRRHGELSRQISAADQVRQIQGERAKAQAEKLSRGRAVTADVVNSEQDAAESELLVTQLRAAQRKLEAQTRLYVSVKE